MKIVILYFKIITKVFTNNWNYIFRFAIQRPYPEGSKEKNGPEGCQEYKSYEGEDRCGWKDKRANGYVGPPYFNERTEGPVLVGNFPSSILVQEGYDSRLTEQRVLEKGIQFIRENANKEVGSFLKKCWNLLVKVSLNKQMSIVHWWAPGSPVQPEPEIRKTRRFFPVQAENFQAVPFGKLRFFLVPVFPGSTGNFPGGSGWKARRNGCPSLFYFN